MVELAVHGAVAFEVAEAILVTIQPRYRMGVIAHSVARLQEVREHAESRGVS